MPNLYTVHAEIHKEINKGYRIKVLLPDLGLYINGFMAFRPHDQYTEWSLVAPSQPAGRGIYKAVTEFDKNKPLWQEIFEACLNAAQAEELAHRPKDVVLEDISDEPIDLSTIPF